MGKVITIKPLEGANFTFSYNANNANLSAVIRNAETKEIICKRNKPDTEPFVLQQNPSSDDQKLELCGFLGISELPLRDFYPDAVGFEDGTDGDYNDIIIGYEID